MSIFKNDEQKPTPPDPIATANAQSGMNRDTAVATQLTNMVDQNGPDGSLAYNQTGSNSYVGADGKLVSIPKFTATTTLSPNSQKVFDIGKQTELNLAGIGRDQSAKIGGILGTNVNLNNDAVEGRLMELGSKRLDPMFARNEEALRTRLTNQGIQPGSQAWNAEMMQFGQNRNDAYDNLLLKGRGESIDEILTERNQPIKEIASLISGSQIQQPTFRATPTAQVGGVDYGGMVNNNYQGQVAQYNADKQANAAMLGGLFGMAGTAATAGIKYSDRKLKSNIRRVGALDNGLPIYLYDIDGRTEIGVMADEVQAVKPQAVHEGERGLMVDYEKATA